MQGEEVKHMMTAVLPATPVAPAPDAYLASEWQITAKVLKAGAISTAVGLLAVAAAPCTAAAALGTLALFAVLSVPAFRR